MSTATTEITKTRKPRSKTPISVVPDPPAFALQERGRAFRSITFAIGLVTFTGSVHGAVADQSGGLETLCNQGHDPTKIRRTDSCPVCGNSDGSTFVKGRIAADEATVVDADELQAIKDANESYTKKAQLQVVEADETLMLPTGSVYYVSAKGAALTTYTHIAAVIKARPKVVFLTEISFGGAPKLFRLEVAGSGVLTLRELARPEAIRQQPEVPACPIDPVAMGFLEQLVDSSTQPFDPAKLANPHARKLEELLASSTTMGAAGETASVTSIVEQLQASLAAVKAPEAAPKKPRRRRASEPAASVDAA